MTFRRGEPNGARTHDTQIKKPARFWYIISYGKQTTGDWIQEERLSSQFWRDLPNSGKQQEVVFTVEAVKAKSRDLGQSKSGRKECLKRELNIWGRECIWIWKASDQNWGE